ncbi:MAG TPA: lysophospholipid acyltransferase family protein [Chryseosolibacter sp.]|jgi:KDO2-lipid IV(A) lauroyltransferase|nr:lysophospholipid acyltransferase family protein [Chryseosolibacter sp.]
MFLIRLISRLPLSALYVLSDFLFFVTFYLARYRRPLVKVNLAKSFPEKSSVERRKIEKEFYKNLCDYAVETLKLVTISKEELSRRMRFTNMDIPEQFRAQSQSILFLASHQFNWEWVLASASATFPMAIDFVYQPVNNNFFNKLTLTLRTRFGAYPIKRDEVARELAKRRDTVRGIATVADQYPGYRRDKKYFTRFLNQDTVFFMGTNQLALLTQYPAVYYRVSRVRRGYYEAAPVIVATPPYQKTSEVVIEKYVNAVEETIRKYPAGWLWSHKRWKTRHLNG